MKSQIGILAAAAIVTLATPAPAAPPPGPYFNGFESNTNGWFGVNGSTITRRPSGYTNGGGYADGIASAMGNYHARLGLAPTSDTCLSGGGPQPIFYGPFTNWGGYSSVFPTGGYRTAVDIYLDVDWASQHPDRRFDWSSAINDTSGNFRRDFVFNAGTDPLGFAGFFISGGNNSTRCGAFPEDPGHQPIQIVESGWYTFQHSFNGTPGGPLTVTMTVTQKSTGLVMGTWTRSDASDVTGVTVGGNRYGWFVQNEIQDLAIDDSLRTGNCHDHEGKGEFKGKGEDNANFHSHAAACEGGKGDGDVEESDPDSGTNFQSASITSTAFSFDEDSQTLTMIGTGVDNGLPVGFTLMVVDYGDLLPGLFSLVLTDGYAVTGSLVSGSIVVQ